MKTAAKFQNTYRKMLKAKTNIFTMKLQLYEKINIYKRQQTHTCTMVSRFCLDVDTVLVWTDGLMVTTVT